MALITPTQWLERYPRITGPGENTKIATMIDQADALCAGFLGFPMPTTGGRTLAAAGYELYFDGPSLHHRDAVCLCLHPIVEVTSVHADPTRVYTDPDTLLVEDTDYTVDLRDGLLILVSGATAWPVAWRGIKVVLEAGFETAPPDIVAIVSTAVRHLWDLQSVQGQVGFSGGGHSVSLTDTDALLPAAVKEALEPYRVCKVGR